MKKIQLLLILILSSLTAFSQQDTIRSLIISEIRCDRYSLNYLELANMGADTVDLSDFTLTFYPGWAAYPNPSWTTMVHRMSGKLPPGETYLMCDYAESLMSNGMPLHRQGIVDIADEWVYIEEKGTFGGPSDDLVHDSISSFGHIFRYWSANGANLLWYHLENGDSVIVDAVNNNINPSTQLLAGLSSVAGVEQAALTHILVRKANVTKGNPDWDDARGTDLSDAEWMPIKHDGTNMWDGVAFTTAGTHGDFSIDLSSDNIQIDKDNATMTLPWGIRKGTWGISSAKDIFDELQFGPGMAWNYVEDSTSYADSAHSVCQSGDIVNIYACGNDLEHIAFKLNVTDPPNDLALVFPKRMVNDENGSFNFGGAFAFIEPYYVTQDEPGMDTIGNLPYAVRIDTLTKYIEKAPNATWDIVYVDGKERVDLKRGDILRVTAEDGSTTKDYFLDVQDIAKSDNALLAAIRWPDIPYPIDNWKGDTIPNFNPNANTYTVTVPYGMANIPALVAYPQSQNAKVSIKRAVSLSGSQADRTTLITVMAADSETTAVYTVLFEKEKLAEHLQEFNPDPYFSQIIFRQMWEYQFIEIANPGNVPLNLDEYMVVYANSKTPAQAIEDLATTDSATSWIYRWRKYIPGYKNKSFDDWKVNPAVMEQDANVDPTVDPGDVFVIGALHRQAYTNPNVEIPERSEMDIHFSDAPNENVFGETGFKWQQSVANFWNNGTLFLFRIENDSVLTGEKPVTDPEDYTLIDVFGDYSGTAWNVDGRGLAAQTGYTRKSNIWKGNPEPNGSFGDSLEDSEWVSYTPNDNPSSDWTTKNWATSHGIGNVTIDPPITVYKSTVTSTTYLVDDGYQGDLGIIGIVTGTTAQEFMDNIIKADTGQSLTVLSGSSGAALQPTDAVTDGDTLKVVSADMVNTTKYLLTVTAGGLDHNATLIAVTGSGYTINIDGDQGTIEGIAFGSTVAEVLSKVEKPATATLNVIDGKNNLVPLKTLNKDTIQVPTRVIGEVYFEVTAQDGETVITYLLKLDISASDAWIESDVYTVIQGNRLITLVPLGTSVSTLLDNLVPSGKASMVVMDKAGFVRDSGYIVLDDVVVVTSEDQSVSNTYKLKMLGTELNTEAWVTSDQYFVSDAQMDISSIPAATDMATFLSHIFPAPGATLLVKDGSGTVKTEGDILEGDQLQVASEDYQTMVVYTLKVLGTSTGSIRDHGIRVFPNPANDVLNITGLEAGSTLTLSNITGQKMKIIRTDEGTYSISLKELPAGLYFLSISGSKAGLSTFRIVKQ